MSAEQWFLAVYHCLTGFFNSLISLIFYLLIYQSVSVNILTKVITILIIEIGGGNCIDGLQTTENT